MVFARFLIILAVLGYVWLMIDVLPQMLRDLHLKTAKEKREDIKTNYKIVKSFDKLKKQLNSKRKVKK